MQPALAPGACVRSVRDRVLPSSTVKRVPGKEFHVSKPSASTTSQQTEVQRVHKEPPDPPRAADRSPCFPPALALPAPCSSLTPFTLCEHVRYHSTELWLCHFLAVTSTEKLLSSHPVVLRKPQMSTYTTQHPWVIYLRSSTRTGGCF